MSSTLFEVTELRDEKCAANPTAVAFTVFGHPQPQGSSRAFYVKSLGRAVITSTNKNLKPWRQQITETAMTLSAPVIQGPVAMSLVFYFKRPKSVKKTVIYKTSRPDTDKLIRSVLDSLTGVLYQDDSQVARFDRIEKLYGDTERVEIQVVEIR